MLPHLLLLSLVLVLPVRRCCDMMSAVNVADVSSATGVAVVVAVVVVGELVKLFPTTSRSYDVEETDVSYSDGVAWLLLLLLL